MYVADFLRATIAYLLGINAAAWLVFAWDKYSAQRQMRRVPQRTLLALAAVGGSLGAVTARWMLRHKTRKQPFSTYLGLILLLQAVLLAALSFPQGRNALWELVQPLLN
jgi:uncharacterized membrane protein YsdA (DUF1294 family)